MQEDNSILVTLALPVYNEEAGIVEVLQDCVRALEALDCRWEIVVIDNCSRDRTAEVVAGFISKDPRSRMVRHEENRLYSGSCETALKSARGKFLVIMDSDGQMSPWDVKAMMDCAQKGKAVVFGWRRGRSDGFGRMVVSTAFNLMGKVILRYPYHDLNCGMRLCEKSAYQAMVIKHRINMVNPELFVRARMAGLETGEVPVKCFPRKYGATSHNFLKLATIFLVVLRYMRALRQELTGGRG